MNEGTAPRSFRWWFPQVPAERLAMLRILVGAYSVVYFGVRLPYWLSFARHRAVQFQPIGVLSSLDDPLEPAVYQTLVFLTFVGSVFFLLGFGYRAVAPMFAALLLIVLTYANSWGGILHTDNLWLLHVVILALAPAADALSLDARKAPSPASPHFKYGWAIRLMCWVVVCAYFLAGLAKLKNSGWGFVEGSSLRNFVAMDNVRKIELGSPHSPLGPLFLPYPEAFQFLAVASLGLELGAPLVMLNRGAAKLWSIAMWSFHIGVLALMAILFLYPVTFIAFAPFFRTERLAGWLRRRVSKHLNGRESTLNPG
ncbi:MAG: HTTM domain-containing protein [Deltaproteobacteria bacterium]|nr:HTTM domain-containing protein [Deltaproteobacteria bacterium]MBW2213751.1 HTTM domain-containing protein [Deltaproteobacteria bacterium]MBW2379291.1 HTTM domain-containing protein [Deltaproteobacteria bacterium]MBW2550712.1 HTTM domain-containing protein [Deltaproteobacteria bacterium]MBW2628371.1 HTTM domain-containing protein [Deltaproteobacteria bacterium]